MRSHVRVSLVALIVSALAAVAAPAAQASFGIEAIFAANCNVSTCGEFGGPALKNSELFTQAAGHPPAGITAFQVTTDGKSFPNAAPTGIVTHVRTDVAPGVSTSPEAVEKCSFEQFGTTEVSPGFFLEPKCKAASEIGVNQVVVYLGPEASPKGGDLPVEGKVYNLEQPTGLASDFGVALKLPLPLTEVLFKGTPLEKVQLYAHTLIEGGVEWGAESKGTGKADYHDYYEIKVSTTLPLISSRLILEGTRGTTGHGGFITNPSSCTGTGPQTTTTISVTPKEGETAKRGYSGPLGTEGCKEESAPLDTSLQTRIQAGHGNHSAGPARRDNDRTDAAARRKSDRYRLLAAEDGQRHPARRHDAEPVGRGGLGSLHAGPGQDSQLRPSGSRVRKNRSSARSR